jgi:excisionase family DNA binding protein
MTEATTAAPDIAPELLTEREAAALLGIGTRTLWGWARSGVCPAPRKLGRGLRPSVRYSRRELLRWIEAGCQPLDCRNGARGGL